MCVLGDKRCKMARCGHFLRVQDPVVAQQLGQCGARKARSNVGQVSMHCLLSSLRVLVMDSGRERGAQSHSARCVCLFSASPVRQGLTPPSNVAAHVLLSSGIHKKKLVSVSLAPGPCVFLVARGFARRSRS